MITIKRSIILIYLIFLFGPTNAQPEVKAWGNMTGIRIEGQLMKFGTSLRIIKSGWTGMTQTAKEQQRPDYSLEGKNQLVSTRIDSIYLKETFEATGTGRASIDITLNSHKDTLIAGVFFCIELPQAWYTETGFQLIEPTQKQEGEKQYAGENVVLNTVAKGISFTAPLRQIEINFTENTELIVKKNEQNENNYIEIYIPVVKNALSYGQTAGKSIKIAVKGEIDHLPAHISVNTRNPGRSFKGIGGNFRLQNPQTDPPVIDYCLNNLRVAWARVEMPWRFWQPDESKDPLEAARSGNLHPRVKAAMEMAQRLDRLGIPVILSDWSAPPWAIEGQFSFRPQPGGLRGNPLNKDKLDKIYGSITSYIIFLKEKYGVEAKLFSFNESDLGINIRQTAEEHAALIKELGAYFAAHGLNTKILLGDTADANGYPWVNKALEVPGLQPYIGAVSFHSWRGWTDETLSAWDRIAKKIHKPLIVGEGSIDAAAWHYPDIFLQPDYAIDEISLYIRILAICQPLSILQWQLTADYSVLAGGGVFGNQQEPLHPTQRFWNLKQLGSTPEGLFHMPVTSDKPEISCAALGDNKRKMFAMHLVNNGPSRDVIITGLPVYVKSLKVYITDSDKSMQNEKPVKVNDGRAEITAGGTCFISLMTE